MEREMKREMKHEGKEMKGCNCMHKGKGKGEKKKNYKGKMC